MICVSLLSKLPATTRWIAAGMVCLQTPRLAGGMQGPVLAVQVLEQL